MLSGAKSREIPLSYFVAAESWIAKRIVEGVSTEETLWCELLSTSP